MEEKNRPTKDLKVDDSLLTEEQKRESGYHFPWWILIVCGVIAVLMIACIIVICNI